MSARLAFDELTPTGRARRLRGLAAAALAHYDVEAERLELVALSFNTLFRVRHADGWYLVRIGPAEAVHEPAAAEAEASWTAQLARAGLVVPRVVPTVGGAVSVSVSADDVSGRRTCALLTWSPGRPPARPVDATTVVGLARLAAALHTAAASAAAAAPTRPPGALDGRRALLFSIPDRLDELSAQYGRLFRDAHKRAQDGIDTLWAAATVPPMLLHADLTPSNVLRGRGGRDGGGLVAIDFQDLTWGHAAQDLAHTLFGLAHDDPQHRFRELFRAEYERVRPWPDCDAATFDHLTAARRLQMVNLGLTLRRPGLEERITTHGRALAAYLQRHPIRPGMN